MRFAEVVRGTRADVAAELPRFDGQPEEMPPIKAAVRALNGVEEDAILVAAMNHAKAQGVAEPKSGEPIYDFALMVETVAAAYVDPDSPVNDRVKMFDSVDLVRKWYGREAIAYLYEVQQHHQDKVAPTALRLSPIEYAIGAEVLGGESETEALSFFFKLRPGLRWNLLRTLAVQRMSLLAPKSTPGLTSEASSQTESEPQPTS
jgi:hypothetical protein